LTENIATSVAKSDLLGASARSLEALNNH